MHYALLVACLFVIACLADVRKPRAGPRRRRERETTEAERIAKAFGRPGTLRT